MTEHEIIVIVDVHEPQEIKDLAKFHPDVDKQFLAGLDAGDLNINGVGFERKTMGDYISSLKEGRLEDQIEKLEQKYEEAYILIEGDLSEAEDREHTSIPAKSIRGHIASVNARTEVTVIPVGTALDQDEAVRTTSMEMLVDYAVRQGRKHVEPRNRKRLPTSDVEEPDAPVPMKIYGCLPGVGAKTAEALYQEFPNASEFAIVCRDGMTERLTAVDGIGEKTADNIINSFKDQ